MALVHHGQLRHDNAQTLRDSAEQMILRCALPRTSAQRLAVYGESLWHGLRAGAGGQDLFAPARHASLQTHAVQSFEDAMQRRLAWSPTPPNAEAREPT